MRLEKTDREDAVRGLGTIAGEDLAAAAAVTPDRAIPDAAGRERLRVRLGGPGAERVPVKGGRQTVADGVLTVDRERLDDLPPAAGLGTLEQAYLKPEALIQSDHERIRAQARAILGSVSATAAPLEAARLLVDWVHRSIEKRPVLSLPDALSTLEHRMGDCNEHAVLLAALARAAGIPARVEAGVVYLRGRFYYHAWNLLYVGRWVTADATFGQLPADVTHLRLVTGSAQQQLDLLGVMGNLTIEVIE
jgi:transglutaminase-like putative cysteine protease